MALTGLDFHQLDSFEGFHQLISDPPFPRFSQRASRRLAVFLALVAHDVLNAVVQILLLHR
jgi:hypothetical protein